MQQLNLTWKVTNYTGDVLSIKLDFNNGSYLSPMVVQDTLIVWINENKTFFQQLLPPNSFLNKNYTILETKIPKQLKDTSLQRAIDAATDNA